MRAPGTRHGGGMTFERLRSSVSRDAYSDYLPMVAWVEEEEAFLCIDDGWGQAWEQGRAAPTEAVGLGWIPGPVSM